MESVQLAEWGGRRRQSVIGQLKVHLLFYYLAELPLKNHSFKNCQLVKKLVLLIFLILYMIYMSYKFNLASRPG